MLPEQLRNKLILVGDVNKTNETIWKYCDTISKNKEYAENVS